MGRVYNALIRAERWGDHTHPLSAEAAVQPAPVARPEPVELAAANTAAIPGTPGSPPLLVSQAERRWTRTQPDDAGAQEALEPARVVRVDRLTLDPHLAAFGSDDSIAERFRTLAVRLFNLGARRKLRSLLITSAAEGEGKSTVAANLAWVMANRGERRVLLIDADLRRPSISRMLGIKPSHGWIQMLEGRVDLNDAVVRIDPNGLCVLTPWAGDGGRYSANSLVRRDALARNGESPSDALTSTATEELIQALEDYFDFILIDAPPILEFADAQRLASIVDGTVLVVKAGQTNHSAVTDALKLVPKERRVGVVLNESQVKEESGYYGARKKRGPGRLFGLGR